MPKYAADDKSIGIAYKKEARIDENSWSFILSKTETINTSLHTAKNKSQNSIKKIKLFRDSFITFQKKY
jgi:hypothetical protein